VNFLRLAKQFDPSIMSWPEDAVLVVASYRERAFANRYFITDFAVRRGLPVAMFSLVKKGQKTNDIEEQFYFVPGAPAIITKNVSVSNGVANGIKCTLVRLCYDAKNADDGAIGKRLNTAKAGDFVEIDPPTFVFVRVDGIETEISLGPETEKKKNNTSRHILNAVTYHVELSFACAYHKVQGLTVKNIVLELNKRI
jgi:ATP-dependent exoDNAse (exonuclease V) alpha subunit